MSQDHVTHLLNAQRTELDHIAQAWLSSGAGSVVVSVDDRNLMQWPAAEPASSPRDKVCVEPISWAGDTVGQLRVTFPVGSALPAGSQLHVRADAALISQLIRLQSEMGAMGEELAAAKDQLLTFYDLSHVLRRQQSAQSPSNSRAHLTVLVSEVARLTHTHSMCYVQPESEPDPWVVAYPAPFIRADRVAPLLQQAGESAQLLPLDPADQPDDLRDADGSLLIIPMQAHGVRMAGLILKTGPGMTVASSEFRLAKAIAEQVGAHIENVLLYHALTVQTRLRTEVELAQQMQAQLLPQHIPSVPGLEIAAGSKPAFQVGGDFYDLIYKPGKPFIFTVGDATGKGLSAALIMAMSHSVLRSAANFMPQPLPANLLRRVNDNLYSDLTDLGIFVTAFAGYYIPQQHELVFASAGHSPVIYKPLEGRARLLEADGPPVGVVPESLSDNQRIPLCPGDVIVAATDGFSEAHNADYEMLGVETLMAHVEQVASQPASAIASSLFQLVDDFAAGHPQDDDQTLVVVKCVMM
jgi:sigma-B regulation protein RsbU (phosphoserine phosphatase)